MYGPMTILPSGRPEKVVVGVAAVGVAVVTVVLVVWGEVVVVVVGVVVWETVGVLKGNVGV